MCNSHFFFFFFLCVCVYIFLRYRSKVSTLRFSQSGSARTFSYLCLGAVRSAWVETQTYADNISVSSGCQRSRSNGWDDMVWQVFSSLLPGFIPLIVFCVIAADWAKTHLINPSREMMGLGRNSRKRRRRRRRMPSLTSEEGRRGFSARFDGMQTHALLKQYRGAASFIYRDEEKHSSLSAALLGERSAENAVVHISTQCFPLPLRMTNAGTRVSVLSSALSPSCPNLNIPVSRHLSLFCFSLYHRVFVFVPRLLHLLYRVCARHHTQREYRASNLIEV